MKFERRKSTCPNLKQKKMKKRTSALKKKLIKMLGMVILGTHKEYRYGSGADIDDSCNADSVRDSSS